MQQTGSKHRTWTWIPLIGYALIIFYFSSRPLPDFAPLLSTSDLLLHFTAFTLFGVLAAWTFGNHFTAWPHMRVVAVAALLSVAYGISDEAHQYFVPGRYTQAADAAADAAGSFLGSWVWFGLVQLIHARATEPLTGPSEEEAPNPLDGPS